jgi:RNA polymerase sigma factor (sigma-70 family)
MKVSCRNEVIEHVRAAVAELPEKSRILLQLYYLEGKSCQEIAEEVSRPKGTVQYQLSEARRALTNRLKEAF